MAKAVIFLMVGAALLMGCQQASVVNTLPMPNLDGPIVMAPAPQAAPVAKPLPLPIPKMERPRAQSIPDVPADWLPPVQANDWKWIVIHHSASASGCAATFDRAHRQKGWDELAYHFVIGNGTGTADGQVEAGSRWLKQKWGAHAKTADNHFNNYGIGICLVGNFDIDRPTAAQIRSLVWLTGHLMWTYHISPDRVIGHCDAKPTDCPGRNMSVAEVRRQSTIWAETHAANAEPVRTASRDVSTTSAR